MSIVIVGPPALVYYLLTALSRLHTYLKSGCHVHMVIIDQRDAYKSGCRIRPWFWRFHIYPTISYVDSKEYYVNLIIYYLGNQYLTKYNCSLF